LAVLLLPFIESVLLLKIDLRLQDIDFTLRLIPSAVFSKGAFILLDVLLVLSTPVSSLVYSRLPASIFAFCLLL
jgi:hypothetical protein